MPKTINFHDLLNCVDREIMLRGRNYPRWTAGANPRMRRHEAEKEYRRMWEVRDALVLLHAATEDGLADPEALEVDGSLDDSRAKFPERHSRELPPSPAPEYEY